MTTAQRFLAPAALAAAVLVPLSAPPALAVPTCFGLVPNVVGTSGDDRIAMRVGVVDVVYAGGGNDVVLAPGEDGPRTDVGDVVCGGPGDDRVAGGVGDDKIKGGDGNDHLEGWIGTDLVLGGAGDDSVEDQPIESNLGADADVLRGGTGNDVVIGGMGADELYGGPGNDGLADLECGGSSVLSGGLGNDRLSSVLSSFNGEFCGASSSADTLLGGLGTDSAEASRNDVRRGLESVTFPG